MRTVFRRLGLLAVLAVVSAFVLAVPATGHFTETWHGNDHAWVDSSHDHLNGSDNECDGNRIYTRGYDASGARGPKYDPDGCGGYYGHLDGVNFTSYKLCEEGVSCTAYRGT